MIQCQKDDIADKRLGAIATPNPGEYEDPLVIWVRMLKHPKPQHADSANLIQQNVFSLRGKFNSIMEECIFEDGNGKHFIMSIEVDQNDFIPLGDLTSEGSTSFWQEIDCPVKKFDRGEISLKPRHSQPSAQNQANLPQQPKSRSPQAPRDT